MCCVPLQLTPEAPALLLTDNNALRRVASEGDLAGMIGPAYQAQHILGGCDLMPAAAPGSQQASI